MKIYELIPDPELLLALAPDELGHSLLRVAHANLQQGIVHRDVVISIDPRPGQERPYREDEGNIRVALIEALHWIESQGLLLPAPGGNGQHGHRIFSRRGRELLDKAQFDEFRRAAAFPKHLLHPRIMDRVWITLARGEYDIAVFTAFRAVEEAVREAGNYGPEDIGVNLVRRAFHAENGPLTNREHPIAEREGLANLFAGAIGSYKNPHSHRTVAIRDHTEAQEMVMLASHLLRIVESRL